jgi:hypothetical protein
VIYFLDTNVLVDANKFHFSIRERQDYWNWLLSLGREGQLKIPETVYGEVKDGYLAEWLEAHKDVFFCKTEECLAALPKVAQGYGDPLLSEEELEMLKADPFIIAHAIVADGTVVTHEKPNNATAPKNKKIPSVCQALGVPCLTLLTFMWEMRRTLPE